jgi:hypothetical protein
MILTDSTQLEAGVTDFIYVCKKQPFAITCSPYLPKISENYVDLDMVLKMNIPMKNIQCTRLHYAGQNSRIVGQISQTIQCVVAGKTHGTAHLKAKVVRDLNKLFHADCVAGQLLYKKLMDPTSNYKEVNPRAHNRDSQTISKQNSGSQDIYTNISTVIANDTSDDDSENSASNTSHDDELGKFLALQTDEARAQAVEDYPELARCLEHYVDRNSNTTPEDELKKFFALQSEDYREQAMYDYPEIATILQPDENKHQLSTPDPVLAAIARQGIGTTDAHIMSINAYNQPHMPSSMAATNYNTRQTLVDPTACSSTYASNLGNDSSAMLPDDSLTNLMTKHGYPDDDRQDLMFGPGYHDYAPEPDLDQVSLHSDTAEYFCRLCQKSDQPDIVTFSHNLLDPSCPSMEDDEPFDPRKRMRR